MASLAQTWKVMSMFSRVAVIGGAAAMLVIIYLLASGVFSPRQALVYGGLDARAAGEVVAALDQMGVQSEVRGDSIYVASSERDRVRLALARDGLPRPGQTGYELLDELSGFGTTSEMYRTHVLRAQQGELERTVLAVPGVTAARVHIARSERRAFGRNPENTSASVLVTSSGGPISENIAMSIRYMVALAIADLKPSQVAVIDARHGVILRPGDERAQALNGDEEHRRRENLREEISSLLAARLGRDAFRVSVTVQTSRERQTLTQRLVDPESGVPITQERESISQDETGVSSAVTVASNLPDGDAAAGGENQSTRNESRETVRYQYSETVRDQVTEPGAVERLGVAVLVDEITTTGPDGETIYQPRTQTELEAIEDLVKSAIAFDAERGDVVTVGSLRFAEGDVVDAPEPISSFDLFLRENSAMLVQMAALATVALVLGLFVVRPILTREAESAADFDMAGGARIRLDENGFPMFDDDGRPMLAGENEDGLALPADTLSLGHRSASANAEEDHDMDPMDKAALALGAHAIETDASQPQAEVLRQIVQNKEEHAIALLKRWLNMPHDIGHAEAELALENGPGALQ